MFPDKTAIEKHNTYILEPVAGFTRPVAAATTTMTSCPFFLQIANMKVQITSLGMHMRYALGLRHGAICTLPLAFGFGQMAWISTPAAVRIRTYIGAKSMTPALFAY